MVKRNLFPLYFLLLFCTTPMFVQGMKRKPERSDEDVLPLLNLDNATTQDNIKQQMLNSVNFLGVGHVGLVYANPTSKYFFNTFTKTNVKISLPVQTLQAFIEKNEHILLTGFPDKFAS